MGKEIIIVTISLGNDGAERILTELARQWHHDGHRITVIQTSPNRYGTEYALPEGIEQIQIHTTSSNKILRFLQEIKALIGILKQRPNATCLSFLSASSFIFQILYKDEGISFQIRLMAIYQNLTKGNVKRLL